MNYLRNIIEDTGSIFNEIHGENDVGIDAIVELFSNEQPTNKLVAFQVKSGSSYYDKKKDLCLIPVEDHYDYWVNYPIPVYGLVYIPAIKIGYWVNIKNYFEANGKVSVIKYQPKTLNTFNEEYLVKVFSPIVSNELPKISFEEAANLLISEHFDESSIGLTILFKIYANDNRAWDKIFDFFKTRDVNDIPVKITYYLAHIPWHPDIWGHKESYTEGSKQYAKSKLRLFDKEELVKLISFIDEENLIARGTPGQNVKAITSIIDDITDKLIKIIEDVELPLHTRAVAALLYAYNKGPEIKRVIDQFNKDEPWFVHVMIDTIVEDPNFMPL